MGIVFEEVSYRILCNEARDVLNGLRSNRFNYSGRLKRGINCWHKSTSRSQLKLKEGLHMDSPLMFSLGPLQVTLGPANRHSRNHCEHNLFIVGNQKPL